MAYNYEYPYVDPNRYNCDWLLHEITRLSKDMLNFINLNTIKYADPIAWDITTQYEANTIVIDNKTGNAYISTKPVPAGVLVTNIRYWTVIYNYQNIIDKVESSISFVNNSDYAEKDIADNTLFWYSDELYKAIRELPEGTELKNNVNIERVVLIDWINKVISSEVATLNTAITDLDSRTDLIESITRVDVKSYGAIGDGVTDDTNAIQTCIDKNPSCAIVFNGIFKVTSTIKVPTEYGSVLCINGSTLLAGTTDMTVVSFTKDYNPENFHKATTFYGIDGGTIDGAGLAKICIVNNDNRGIFRGVRLCDFKDTGFYDGSEGDPSGQTFISDMSIIQQRYETPWSEGNTTGIVLNAPDCRLSNISIMRCRYGIRCEKSGHILSNVYIYGQINKRIDPNISYADYDISGIVLTQSGDDKLPIMGNNIYFDTIRYAFNNKGSVQFNISFDNIQLYADNLSFDNAVLFLLTGNPACYHITNINTYDRSYVKFYKGEYNTVSGVENNASNFDVNTIPNYWNNDIMCLGNYGNRQKLVHAVLASNSMYHIARLCTTEINGMGQWELSLNFNGLEDLKVLIGNYNGTVKVLKTSNAVGNLQFMFVLDTKLKSFTITNGVTLYYYDVFIKTLTTASDLWITVTGNSKSSNSSIYTWSYANPLPIGTAVDPLEVNVYTGDRFISIGDSSILARTYSDGEIEAIAKKYGVTTGALRFTNTVTIPANGNIIAELTAANIPENVRYGGILTQFVSTAGLLIGYTQNADNKVYARIYNITNAEIANATVDVWYTTI